MQKIARATNWFEFTEQKRTLLISGIIILCMALLAVTLRRKNLSYDSFWHLQMGLDWLYGNKDLWRDHFSFTFNGGDITDPPYMFEISLAWLVTQLGLDPGFEVFKLGAFALVFVLVVFFLRKLRSPAVVYCLVLPLLVVLLQLRSIVRPELISYSFCVVALMLYYRARDGITPANMIPIVALMLAWSNYHQSILGYVIFFGYFVDIALRQLHDRAPASNWLRWLGWGMAVVAAGFLRPGFNHPLVNMLFFSPGWAQWIQEYQPAARHYHDVAAIYSLIVIAMVTLALLLRKRQFGLLLVCFLLIYFSFDMVRMVTPSGIIILCIFTWTASEIDLGKLLRRLSGNLGRVTGATMMVLFALTMTSAVNNARSYMKDNRISGLIFPGDVADYMVGQGISGRIFNTYDIGGYLIYRLSPDSQVYIDGRTGILYPLYHYERHWKAERSSDVLRAEIEKYAIDLAVLNNRQRNYSLVEDAGMLGLDFVGARFSLFRRDDPNFTVLGTLLANPACWNTGMSVALEEEHARAFSLAPVNSFLPGFAQFVAEYTKSDDKSAFLAGLERRRYQSAATLRFAGHQALIQHLDAKAYELFSGISEKEFSDYLGGALAKARLGDWKTAERLLNMATQISASDKFHEISILHGLLTQIRPNSALELFDDAYVNRLASDIGVDGDSTAFSLSDIHLFCPGSLDVMPK